MDIFKGLAKTLEVEYDTIKILKKSDRGSVSVVRSRRSGNRYIYRVFDGGGEAYKKLLGVSCAHLPKIYEVGECDGRTSVLEEYIYGDSLSFVLEGGTLPTAEARKIMKQLCSALWVMHGMGVVHRDIKPENIIIRGDEAVLVDFDASRTYKSENEYDTQILGTTGFAAPEQYGISQSDERADIYSLGVLLNIMLTGKHPSKEMADGTMGRIVQKCTMTNPGKRYKNVLYLMEAL